MWVCSADAGVCHALKKIYLVRFYFAHPYPCFRTLLPIFARSEASYSVQLSLFIRSMDESDILDDARLYDEPVPRQLSNTSFVK